MKTYKLTKYRVSSHGFQQTFIFTVIDDKSVLIEEDAGMFYRKQVVFSITPYVQTPQTVEINQPNRPTAIEIARLLYKYLAKNEFQPTN